MLWVQSTRLECSLQEGTNIQEDNALVQGHLLAGGAELGWNPVILIPCPGLCDAICGFWYLIFNYTYDWFCFASWFFFPKEDFISSHKSWQSPSQPGICDSTYICKLVRPTPWYCYWWSGILGKESGEDISPFMFVADCHHFYWLWDQFTSPSFSLWSQSGDFCWG